MSGLEPVYSIKLYVCVFDECSDVSTISANFITVSTFVPSKFLGISFLLLFEFELMYSHLVESMSL